MRMNASLCVRGQTVKPSLASTELKDSCLGASAWVKENEGHDRWWSVRNVYHPVPDFLFSIS